MSTLVLEPVERSRRQLVLRYRFDDLAFSTSYWYDSVDFLALEQRFGEAFMRKVYFHLLAFEANKAASLAPTRIDPGPYADMFTDSFWTLWETLFHNVWAVWRYESDLPDYRLSRPGAVPGPEEPAIEVEAGPVDTLMLCGGGKDSLVSMNLLETGGVAYDAFVYSHSTYGRGAHQHELIDGLLAHTDHQRLHRGWVIDDAVDSPAVDVDPSLGVKRILAAETISSYWTALPVALQHGYRSVALGISASTDEHNLTWDRTGEDVNYLWGMSGQAEALLHDYIRSHIVSNVAIFHILRPIYDINIFAMLNERLDAVPATHSCARLKPWCGNCAKCVYVWMSYHAWLPTEVVERTIPVNLFDEPSNGPILRKMLGLESYKPTDCVGTVSEARLAFLMCRKKGVEGVIADDIDLTPMLAEAPETLAQYTPTASPQATFPDHLASEMAPHLEEVGVATRAIYASIIH